MKKGEHITKRRKELGITSVAELAEKVGVKQQSAFQWERGGGIRGANKENLAAVLGVSSYWIDDGWRDDFIDPDSFKQKEVQENNERTTPKDKMIAIRIVEERTNCGYSQQCLAEKADVPITELQSYEFGEKVIPIDFLTKLAANGLDIQYILTGKKSQSASDSNSNIATTGINQGSIQQINGR